MSAFDDHDHELGSGADDAHDWATPGSELAEHISAAENRGATDSRLDPDPKRDRLLQRERSLLRDGEADEIIDYWHGGGLMIQSSNSGGQGAVWMDDDHTANLEDCR